METVKKTYGVEAEWEDLEQVRADFPLLHNADVVYLDNSATSQKPRQVIEKEKEYYEYYNANPFRGLYGISVQATDAYEAARAKIAAFIGAKQPEELIFTRNATESLNLVAFTMGEKLVGQGDEIITSVMEHHSNMLPWRALADRKGAQIRYMEPEEDGTLDPEKLRAMMSDKVKIVALSGMSNIFGKPTDLKALAAVAHEFGAIFVADGAQSVPHVKTNVQDLDVDFLAFSGHKMLAPMGIGALYGKMELLKKMPPFMSGGEMIETVSLQKIRYAEIPHKFEAGTVNTSGAIAFGAAIDYLNEVGLDRIEAREEMLTVYAAEKLMAIPHVHLLGSQNPADHHGILTFQIEGVHPHDISAILDVDHIGIRAGHHCAQPLHQHLGVWSTTRASLMFYNTKEEIDAFIASVSTIRRQMGYAD